jgi:hypothetical protein
MIPIGGATATSSLQKRVQVGVELVLVRVGEAVGCGYVTASPTGPAGNAAQTG